MTRRDLGKAAAGAAMMQKLAAQTPAAKYTGALDGFEAKVNAAEFDPVAYTKKLYDEAPMRMTFRAQRRADAEAWQKTLRPKIAELVGGFPEKRTPLNPQTLEVREFPNYRREK